MRSPVAGYAPHVTQKRPPLGAYAALLGTFSGVFGGLLARGIKTGSLPSRLRAKDVGAIGLATFVLGRTLAKDEVTSAIRAPFMTFKKRSGAGTVEEESRGEGMQLALGQLLGCPYCLAPWVAGSLTAAMVVAPRATRMVCSVAASVAIAQVANQGYTALRRMTE